MARLKSRHAIVTFKARLVTIAAKIYMVFEVVCSKEFLQNFYAREFFLRTSSKKTARKQGLVVLADYFRFGAVSYDQG